MSLTSKGSVTMRSDWSLGSRAALEPSLDWFEHFYNPHQGYRLRRKPPTALVGGAVHA